MRIRWLRTALANLDQEAEYIAADDPRAAARIMARIREAVERLATHPWSGRPGRVPGTRESIVPGTPYLVPYRVRGNAVEILRVFHGARRRPEQL